MNKKKGVDRMHEEVKGSVYKRNRFLARQGDLDVWVFVFGVHIECAGITYALSSKRGEVYPCDAQTGMKRGAKRYYYCQGVFFASKISLYAKVVVMTLRRKARDRIGSQHKVHLHGTQESITSI